MLKAGPHAVLEMFKFLTFLAARLVDKKHILMKLNLHFKPEALKKVVWDAASAEETLFSAIHTPKN